MSSAADQPPEFVFSLAPRGAAILVFQRIMFKNAKMRFEGKIHTSQSEKEGGGRGRSFRQLLSASKNFQKTQVPRL